MTWGRTTARGYGRQHQQLRARWAPYVNNGRVACARCGQIITPGTPWDLGHDDHDRSIYRGPEHRHARHCPAGGNRATTRRRPADPPPKPRTNW